MELAEVKQQKKDMSRGRKLPKNHYCWTGFPVLVLKRKIRSDDEKRRTYKNTTIKQEQTSSPPKGNCGLEECLNKTITQQSPFQLLSMPL